MGIQRYTYVKALEELITKMDRINKTPCKNASERFSKKFSQLKCNAQAGIIGISAAAQDAFILLGVTLVAPVKLKFQIIRAIFPGAFQNWNKRLDRLPTGLDQITLIFIDLLGVSASAAGVALGMFKGSEWNVAMQKSLYNFSSPKPINLKVNPKPKPSPPKPSPKVNGDQGRADRMPGNRLTPPPTPSKLDNPVKLPLQVVPPNQVELKTPTKTAPPKAKLPAWPPAQTSHSPAATPPPVISKQLPAWPPMQTSPFPAAAPHLDNYKQLPSWPPESAYPSPEAAPPPVSSKQQPARPLPQPSEARPKTTLAKPSAKQPSRSLPPVPEKWPGAPQVKPAAAGAVNATPTEIKPVEKPTPSEILQAVPKPDGSLAARRQSPPKRPVPLLAIKHDDLFASQDSEDGEDEDGVAEAQRRKNTKDVLLSQVAKEIRQEARQEIHLPSGGRVRSPAPNLSSVTEPRSSPIQAQALATQSTRLRRTLLDGDKTPRSKKVEELKRIEEEESLAKKEADPLMNSQLLLRVAAKPAAAPTQDSKEADWAS